jgi:hypothetical protein
MTKALTQGQRRRNRKRAKISLPGGEFVLAPQERRGPRIEEPADTVAIEARRRQIGFASLTRSEVSQAANEAREAMAIKDDKEREARLKNIRAAVAEKQDRMARSVMMGCSIGRRLLIERLDDRADLWRAVMHMRRVTVAYDRSIGVNRHAQCAGILASAEKLEATAASPAADLRTPEDKARQAQAAWMTLKGWLAHTDYAARSACERAVVDEPDQPLADWTGIVLALRCVVDGLAGRPVQLRERK